MSYADKEIFFFITSQYAFYISLFLGINSLVNNSNTMLNSSGEIIYSCLLILGGKHLVILKHTVNSYVFHKYSFYHIKKNSFIPSLLSYFIVGDFRICQMFSMYTLR